MMIGNRCVVAQRLIKAGNAGTSSIQKVKCCWSYTVALHQLLIAQCRILGMAFNKK